MSNIKRMSRLPFAVVGASAAALALAGPSFAAVTFDPTTGSGFVGKGDVQTPFGWNDQAITKAVKDAATNPKAVYFTYDTAETHTITCQWTTGEGTPGEQSHQVTHTRSTGLNATVAYLARKSGAKDLTGFNLTGFAAVFSDSGPLACPGADGTSAVIVADTVDSSTGGLYVHTNESKTAISDALLQ